MKVNLTVNIDVKLGLTNKSSGVIKKIIKSPNKSDCDIILVQFDRYIGKDIVKDINGNYYKNLIPITV